MCHRASGFTGGVPAPPYANASLLHSSRHWHPSGGASNGSGAGEGFRSHPRLITSSRSSCAPKKRRRNAWDATTAPSNRVLSAVITGSVRRRRRSSRCSSYALACRCRSARSRRHRLEGELIPRGWECGHDIRIRERRELRQKLLTSFGHRLTQAFRQIGEKEERSRGIELLPLKQQRRGATEQQQRRQRAVAARRRELVDPPAERRVRDLVVILQIVHEGVWRKIERRRPATFLLPAVPLPLIQKPVLG